MNLKLHYYLFLLNQLLHGKRKERQGILKFISTNMGEYLASHKNCSFHGLVSYFGAPEKVAAAYNAAGKASKKRFLASKPVVRAVVFTCCWLVALIAVFVLAMMLIQLLAPTTPVYEASEMAQTMQCV